MAEPKTFPLGRAKRKGFFWGGGRNFCPPSLSPLLFSPPKFFVPVKLARRLSILPY